MAKVLVCLSGGLDSSYTAYLLKNEGYDVYGIHFNNGFVMDESTQPIELLAHFLDIPVQYMNVHEQFQSLLMAVDIEMCHMRTPNICVMCARDIKFGFVVKYALEHNFKYVATGHYVRIVHNDERTYVLKGLDETRDQSYGFGVIPLEQLKCTLTPLGNCIKNDIRVIADEIGLPYIKKESRGLCFTHEPFNQFYEKYTKRILTKGYFVVDKHPECTREHNGQQLYVRGQKVTIGKYQYVVNKKLENGNIVISPKKEVNETIIRIKQINFNIPIDMINQTKKYQILIRYNSNPVDCYFEILSLNDIIIRTMIPLYAPTPGQIGTVYDGNIVILGGFIEI